MADNLSRYIFELSGRTVGLSQLKTEMQEMQDITNRFGMTNTKVSRILDRQETSFMKGGKQIKQFATTWKATDGQIYKTTRTLNQINGQWVTNAKSIKTTGLNTVAMNKALKGGTPIASQYITALKRVAIVVPVWMLFRQAIQAVFQTLSMGIKYWSDFEAQLYKAKAVIHTTSKSIGEAYTELQAKAEELANKTGTSMDKIVSAFYRFGTVGLSFEESLAGAEASLKTATAMMGDVDDIAKVLAQTYLLLGDTLDDNLSIQDKMASQGAILYELWKKNAFEINEMTGALQQFLPTANTANFTFKETTALLGALQSAGLKGTRAGRLLRTSITKLTENLNKVGASLGLYVNPELEGTFDVFMRILGAIKDLSKQGKLPVKAIESISEIFGGVRGGEPVKALTSLFDTLQDNLKATDIVSEQLLKNLTDRFNEFFDTLPAQQKKLKQFQQQLGKTFVASATGQENFTKGLKAINNELEKNIIPRAELMGKIFNFVVDSIAKGGIPLKLMFDHMEKTTEKAKEFAEVTDMISTAIHFDQLNDLEKMKTIYKELTNQENKRIQEQIKNNEELKKGVDYLGQLIKKREEESNAVEERSLLDEYLEKEKDDMAIINAEGKRRIELLRKELDYIKLEQSYYNDATIAQQKLVDYVNEIVGEYNNLDKVRSGIVASLNSEKILTMLIQGRWGEILEITNNLVITQDELIEASKLLNDVLKARVEFEQKKLSMGEKLKTHALNLLNIQGANNRQLAEYNLRLTEALKLSPEKILEAQLELEKAITEEKKNQKDLSSDAIKLYQIARKYGVDVAEELSKVLSGAKPISELGGLLSFDKKALAVFKKEFGDLYEQFQAGEFFKGAGAGITIPGKLATADLEETMRNLQARISEIGLNIYIPNININVDIDSYDIRSKILDAIDIALKDPQSDIAKAIKELIENF